MDYLNYGNQVQKEPQRFRSAQKKQPKKPQPQGFGIDEKDDNLTREDFMFDDLKDEKLNLSQVVPDSPSPQTNKDELIQLFPTPVLVCKCTIDYSKEEKWCRDHYCEPDSNSGDPYHAPSRLNRQSKDTFILDNPELKNIRAFIQQKLDFYVNEVYNIGEEIVITQSWLNKNGRGELHHKHSHPNSIISGVWYPAIHEGLPPLQFAKGEVRDIDLTTNERGFNIFNSHKFIIKMNKGDLILFPSNLDHMVPPNPYNEERISLSFNTWAKGFMGSKKSLTYLPMDRCV